MFTRSTGDSSTSVYEDVSARVVTHIRAVGRTYTIDFNNAHVMTVDPEEKRGERGSVDNTETICLSGLYARGRDVVISRCYAVINSVYMPTWKGRVAFSLNPTLLVTGSGLELLMGGR